MIRRTVGVGHSDASQALVRDVSCCGVGLVNRGVPPAIVLGVGGKEKELLFVDDVRSDRVPVIRRFSGGGTVLELEGVWLSRSSSPLLS